jgi:hypothetical protein
MKVNVKIKEIKRKKVYYAVVEEMEVLANMTDDQIDNILMHMATKNGTLDEGKDYMWSYKDDLLYGG